MSSRSVIALAVALGLGVGAASCDKGPARPSALPPGTAAVTLVRIEIVAPASVEPDGSAQLTASAIKSDGSVENVTSQTQWSSGNAAVLQVSSAGVVSGAARGEATINARYQSQSATARIMVLPSGTFRLNGEVTNSGLPLDGVTVAVIVGTGEGLTAVTSATGAYALYGVAGRIRLHVKKAGFENRIEEVDVRENRAVNIEMSFDGDAGNLSGTYALALEVDGCASAIPDNIRRRSYIATVEQDGSKLSVHLSGADFIVFNGRGDHFDGFVGHDGKITFAIGDAFYYYYYYYSFIGDFDLVERLSPTSALVVAGTVNAASTSSGISGVLSGSVALTQGVVAPFTRFSANCHSAAHRFEMRRQ
jgi:hypothetical protein